MYPHRIHLRGPWEYQPLSRSKLLANGTLEVIDEPVPPPAKMLMPGCWTQGGLTNFGGTLLFRRPFRWPNELLHHERVWLVFTGVDGQAQIRFNQKPLGEHTGPYLPFEFDITPYLKEQNHLEVEVTLPGCDDPAWLAYYYGKGHGTTLPNGGLWGTVHLEVRTSCHLSWCHLLPTWNNGQPRLHIEYKTTGDWPRPLSFRIRLDQKEVHFTDIGSNHEEPRQVELELSHLNLTPWQPFGQGTQQLYQVEVDLLEPAFPLHQFRTTIGFRDKQQIDATHWRINGQVREVEPAPLAEPIMETQELQDANSNGRLILWHVPRFGLPDQVEVINKLLAHHPAFLGCHGLPGMV